jgi:hypothetical protein
MRLLALLLCLLLGSSALARSTETLVLTTATELPRLSARRAFIIANLGAGTIFCADSTTVSVGTGFPIAAGATLAIERGSEFRVWCIAAVAQTSGSGTRVWEVP